jgi:predicted molibdopterin-dependent oxidoreductase YjgC
VEETDLIILWGSNARETHPIFFHHVLKAIRGGAKLYVVDPRRTTTAEWADGWLQLDVGTDISLANCVGRCILDEGLEHRSFIARATEGFDDYVKTVHKYDLARVEKETKVAAELIQRMAREYARAEKAVICWTLGITEHHNAVDNVVALINLSLLTGHVGRWGSGVNPLRGQNNVQGGGDMGALPAKLPGFQNVEDPVVRARYDALWGRPVPPRNGWNLTEMFEAMERKELTHLYVLGENPAQSEADGIHTLKLLEGLEHLIVQDIVMTRTAEMAEVVLPGSASWCEAEGTVTNSERRVQRCRAALTPPGQARDDIAIIYELSRRLGYDPGSSEPKALWDEMRSLSPMHHGMSYERLEALEGIQWPCPDEQHPGTPFLHGRLWDEPVGGRRAPFMPTEQVSPVDELDASFPLRLTTGRKLESYNTGVQSGGYSWPHGRRETIDVHPDDARRLDVSEGERVRVTSRRGSLEVPVHLDTGLRPGLVFMTIHMPDIVDTNVLTINATDPKSGTAEFKASAVRIEKLGLISETKLQATVSQ